MNKVIIEKPRIEQVEGKYRLIATLIYEEKKTYDLWFEVEKEYKDYLCAENSDAFLVAILSYLIKHELDVEVKGAISSQLYYQLTTYLIPLLSNNLHKRNIQIKTEVNNVEFHPKAVGTGISCGVDSFYTFLKHRNQLDNQYNITHLTFFNAGSHGDNGGKEARELFHKRLEYVSGFCKEQNLKLVTVDSNMNEFIKMSHFATHSFRTLGCVLALQKLFKIYYFSSGANFNDTAITAESTADYDILNVQCLSNQNTTVYSSGIEATRMEKVEFIAHHNETYNWLNVCVRHEKATNCSNCEKCIRTMLALDAINELDHYANVFDLKHYQKNKVKFLAGALKWARDHDKKNFEKKEEYGEILSYYKKDGKTVPAMAYILSFIPTKQSFKNLIKKIVPKSWLKQYQINKGTYKNNGWLD